MQFAQHVFVAAGHHQPGPMARRQPRRPPGPGPGNGSTRDSICQVGDASASLRGRTSITRGTLRQRWNSFRTYRKGSGRGATALTAITDRLQTLCSSHTTDILASKRKKRNGVFCLGLRDEGDLTRSADGGAALLGAIAAILVFPFFLPNSNMAGVRWTG